MDKQLFEAWRRYVPNLGEALRAMQDKTIIAIGVAPYPRIVPSIFLDNYAIYCVKDASDLDVLRNYAKIFCLEERHPKIAEKVHATRYLLGNYIFQGFLKSWRRPYRLMFYQVTPKIIEVLEEKKMDWIGNRPDTFDEMLLKGSFRDLVRKLGLPAIPDWRVSRDDFLKLTFKDVWERWGRTAVVQRADFDVAGEMGTFFISKEKDWQTCYEVLSKDGRYSTVTISPFIEGHSLSVLGCITPKGVLTSTLQLQLIDVPQSLHGQLATGVFLGHDWTFHPWPESTEKTAEMIVESLGKHLASHGYQGIFGIDLVYDAKTHEIFPIECNPRFTGALPVYSLMVAANGVPTMEFFHLAAHLNVPVDFDFDRVNAALKERIPAAHISIAPKGILEMKLPIIAGVYSYDSKTEALTYKRPGAFLWDIKNDDEFIIMDSVPRQGGRVIQNVPRMFKLVFARPIARSSNAVMPEIAELIEKLTGALKRNQLAPQNEGVPELDMFGEF